MFPMLSNTLASPEQEQEQICALSPLLGFTAEPKAVSQGQLQQKTELSITRQSLQAKSISISASDTVDPSGSRTRPEDLRATKIHSRQQLCIIQARMIKQSINFCPAVDCHAHRLRITCKLNYFNIIEMSGAEFIAQ